MNNLTKALREGPRPNHGRTCALQRFTDSLPEEERLALIEALNESDWPTKALHRVVHENHPASAPSYSSFERHRSLGCKYCTIMDSGA